MYLRTFWDKLFLVLYHLHFLVPNEQQKAREASGRFKFE